LFYRIGGPLQPADFKVWWRRTIDRRDHPPTAQTPFPPTPTPPKFSQFFKVFRKFQTKIQIIENTRNITNIILIF
jgi:hypothetical protein